MDRTIEPHLVNKKLIQYFVNYKNNKEKSKINFFHLDIFNFVKKNYGFVILMSLFIILLYIRYIDVNRKKKYLKQIAEEKNLNKNIPYNNTRINNINISSRSKFSDIPSKNNKNNNDDNNYLKIMII